MVERPATSLSEAEDLAKQLLAAAALQKHLLLGGTLVAEPRCDRHTLDAEAVDVIEKRRHLLRRLALKQGAVDGDPEALLLGHAHRIDSALEHAVLAHRGIVSLPVAVEVYGEGQVLGRCVVLDAFFQQERIGAQVDILLLAHEALDDLGHFLVKQRLAAGDGYDRGAALVDGVKGFLHADALVEDVIWIVDFSTAGTSEVAAKQGLKHQHQRIALLSPQLLAQDVHSEAYLLLQRDTHSRLLPVGPPAASC